MSGSPESLRRAVAVFGAQVDATRPDMWSRPSPCEGWAASDVLGHCVANLRRLTAVLGGADLSAPIAPTEGDLTIAWQEASADLFGALDAGIPEDRTIQLGANVVPVGYLVDGIMRDLVIHTWDVARAVGGDENLPPDAVADAIAAMALVTDDLRRPGVYGQVVEVPTDADDLTRLLALSGRRR